MSSENNQQNTTEISAVKLSDEIQYQDSGIVSKQLIKKPNGNITLFAFDKDESLTKHTSKFDALAYIVEGEMEFKIVLITMATTFAGNLTLLGSVANLIVAESAKRCGVILFFFEYLKIGIQITVVTLLIGMLWLNIFY